MLVRAILPPWAAEQYPDRRKVVEGDYSDDRLIELNADLYGIFYLPNGPSTYTGGTVDGTHIDRFQWVFADMDLKDKVWATKQEFLEFVLGHPLEPTRIVDSGNGIHVYWKVSDLDSLSFLKLQRRVCREFKTDEAVAKIYQLMRLPGYVNTKREHEFKVCDELVSNGPTYTCEALDSALPPITHSDDEYCKQHYDKTYNIDASTAVDDRIPVKFMHLLRSNKEVKEIWAGGVDDRSRADYRLGHIMFGNGFTKDEARSVLVNTSKALARAPKHRIGYADGIVDQIWTFELEPLSALRLSKSVSDILSKSGDSIAGTRFPCWTWMDNTQKGFRLGHVMGLVAGVGVGKTAFTLNAFLGFVRNNQDYDHFFVTLEQTGEEVSERWRDMCGSETHLHPKVQILTNYDDDGSYRNLSLEEIKKDILSYQEQTGRKVGCVVIDHIGVLKKSSKEGRQSIEDICHQMKAFAIQTNTFLIMQSQAPREKAGEGDLELNKDAAYGTVFFESYCDYLVTLWQPLLRCYTDDGCPTVTAYKFCKIRHRKVKVDKIQQNKPYLVYFDSQTQLMREMTQDEEKSFTFFNSQATNLRQKDRKTDLVSYTKIAFEEEEDGKPNNHKNSGPAPGIARLH